jgi:hypothetical protein
MSEVEAIMAAVAEYRAACDAVQPTWDLMIATPVYYPETVARREARHAYFIVQQRVVDARKKVLELALDGRWETPG